MGWGLSTLETGYNYRGCAYAMKLKKLIKEIQGRGEKPYMLVMAELRTKKGRIGDFAH